MGIRELLVTDETFREVGTLLFGSGADELISKMNPTQSDVATGDRKKRMATAGLSAVGATAGAAGLGLAAKETYHGIKDAPKGLKAGGKLIHAAKNKKLATALIPLEVAGLGGELMSTKILHGDARKGQIQKMSGRKAAALGTGSALAGGGLAIGAVAADNKMHGRKWNQGAPRRRAYPKKVSKGDTTDLLNNVQVPSKRSLTRAVLTNPKVQKKGIEFANKGAGQLKKVPNPITTTNQVEKNLDEIDVIWDAEISKADADKQQIFGWASVVEVNGEPIVDLQGDQISVEEMEKAGYEYVMKSRKGGDMHLRNNWEPIQKSEMIESFIVTPEKREAMGLPDSVPSGWWVGFKVQDPSVWDMVKSGERTGFSIHGHGRRS